MNVGNVRKCWGVFRKVCQNRLGVLGTSSRHLSLRHLSQKLFCGNLCNPWGMNGNVGNVEDGRDVANFQ